jgi:predicted metal-dependent hydrolase
VTGWPPTGARVRGALFQGERHLLREEYLHATLAFGRASAAAEADEYERVRALLHLSAAGYRSRRGDGRAARRQLAHARRRLGPEPAPLHGVDAAALLERVERALPEDILEQPPD